MIPLFKKPLQRMDAIIALKRVLKIYPAFYSAAIDMGQHYFMLGKDNVRMEHFGDGIKSVKENFSKKRNFGCL